MAIHGFTWLYGGFAWIYTLHGFLWHFRIYHELSRKDTLHVAGRYPEQEQFVQNHRRNTAWCQSSLRPTSMFGWRKSSLLWSYLRCCDWRMLHATCLSNLAWKCFEWAATDRVVLCDGLIILSKCRIMMNNVDCGVERPFLLTRNTWLQLHHGPCPCYSVALRCFLHCVSPYPLQLQAYKVCTNLLALYLPPWPQVGLLLLVP